MSTITLYKDKINGVGSLLDDIIKSSNNLSAQLGTLKNTLQGVNSSTCNLNDTVESISSSSKSEEEKVEDLKKLNSKLTDFIEMTAKRDSSAKSEIERAKDDFYTKYSYLKPDCEENKTFWDSICGFVGSAKEWCRNAWNTICNIDIFNVIGQLLHSDWLRNTVAGVASLFYIIGGYEFIKLLAKEGTKLAVIKEKYPFLAAFIPGFNFLSSLAPAFFYVTLGAELDGDDVEGEGIYHIKPDCLQQYAQYTTGYDDIFRAAVDKASGGAITVDVHQSQIFWVDLDENGIKDEGEEFIIWSWKGDYTNLGAGAETGIYQVVDGEKDENGNYTIVDGEYTYLYAEIDRDYSADMSLELYYDKNGDGDYDDNGEKLYNYSPEEKQWWITGFDPLVQNVKADGLKAVTTIDFSSYGDKAEMFLDAFREANSNNSDWIIPEDGSGNYVVTLNWEGE